MAQNVQILEGNAAVSEAVRLCRPQVIAAYPITPQTTIVEKIAKGVDSGKIKTEFICVESEHSAMAACIAAQATGVRTFTATSSHGLLLMHEMLHWASLARLPVIMANVNRAIGPGWNIWCDYNDSMSQRDTGWIQMYASSCQEILDMHIQAFRLGEDPHVMLPVMVCFDGFIISHTSMPVDIPEQALVDKFIPPYKPLWKLDTADPVTHGNIIPSKNYNRVRYSQQLGMNHVPKIMDGIAKEFSETFGRDHGGMIDELHVEDADTILVSVGALGACVKDAVGHMRKSGRKVGAARIRVFRPFPVEELRRICKGKRVIVFDRAISLGIGGIIYTEAKYAMPHEDMHGVIIGIGGQDVRAQEIIALTEKADKQRLDNYWVGVD
jgi:pyruvate/2-oxoacid:ferredoxin oxidoreductase alpha subunit